jgi:Fe-Mn family superoxide dismutase
VTHALPELPYKLDALAPLVSAETLEYHWGKHHRGYVDTLNRLIPHTPFEDLSLKNIVKQASGSLFNQAAQHFNHSLYWRSLSPTGGDEPGGALLEAVRARYGSFAAFRTAFAEQAGSHFGSGWAWLVRKADGSVQIELTHDAGCPLTSGEAPLLVCDLWEHAYYIDHRNLRGRYLESFWVLANWREAEARFEESRVGSVTPAKAAPTTAS